ncbi:hypothetical protein [Streptomyces sp. NPDC046985]|uniref:hypothetical protein n=1 Tax=Streptomyces sp. NPDC046985 TaxID=3155377 RepID=UPI0033EC0EC4
MPDHVSTVMWLGVAIPAVLMAASAVALAGYRYGLRFELRRRQPVASTVIPPQRGSGPHREYVELTPAERAAFAGLMRQLGNGR